jgi:hypothetical protein
MARTPSSTPDVITPPAPTPSERPSERQETAASALQARINELEKFIAHTIAHGLNYPHAAEILKKKV